MGRIRGLLLVALMPTKVINAEVANEGQAEAPSAKAGLWGGSCGGDG